MTRLLAQLLVWFLAVWMPIHAAAAPLMVGHCEKPLARDLHMHWDVPAPEHAHADHVVVEQPSGPGVSMVQEDEARSNASGDGLCCFHLSGFVSVARALTLSFDRDAPVAPVRSAYTFFPDQPQRPPRA